MPIILFLFSWFSFSSVDPDLVKRIDSAISPQIGERATSVVIGIYKNGETHYLTYGNAKTGSFFEIGSITKTFTSLLLSIAIDKNLVSPETKLSELRPEWKGQKAGSITLIELATHRSGLPRIPCDLKPKDPANPYADYTEKQLINSITNKVLDAHKCKLKDRPTSTIDYSNWGAALLGNAISAKTGLSYSELLSQWIAEPLGLTDTVTKLNDEQKKRLLQGHNENMKPTGLWTRQGMMGNGAILSTPADLMKYALAHLRPLSTPLSSAIKRTHILQYPGIGYNWFITAGGNLWHNGATGGFSSLLKLYLKEQMVVFSLSDSEIELRCLIETVDQVPCDPTLH